MTNPKITVSADVSGVQAELQKVQAAAAKINQTLNSGQVGIDAKAAKADLASLEASSKNLVTLLERVKSSGDDLASVDFDSVSEALEDAGKAAETLDKVLDAVGQSSGMAATVKGAKATAEHIGRAAKAHEVLTREGIKLSRAEAEGAKAAFDKWRKSGARGTSRLKGQEFDDWLSGGWRSYSMSESDARRHRADVLRSVGVNPGGGAPGAAGRFAGMSGRFGVAAGALGGMLGGMSGGGDGGLWGSTGNAAGSMLGAGAGAMFGGPVGAIVGAFASRLLGGVGGSVDNGISRVGDESAIYTDLRKSLGATTVDFDLLGGSVRHFTDGMGLAYNESAKLAKEFAHTANAQGDATLGRDVGASVGFGRGFGLDPALAVRFMATMRHAGVTTDEKGNRKLALQIADATQRGGTTAKMDEVLSAVQGYVQTATRASMSTANAEAYASYMASMTGLKMPGVHGDPTSAAAIMGKADASLRQGGAFGDASKNFSLAAYQQMFGKDITAIDAKTLHEQGAFGDFGKAFDNMIEVAKGRNDPAEVARLQRLKARGGGKNALGVNFEFLEKQYGHLPTAAFVESGANHLGMGQNEFAAAYQAYKTTGGLGGLEKTLADAGVDMDGLKDSQIASLAALAGGDNSAIKAQAARLRGLKGVSDEDRKQLDADTDEKMRSAVLRLTAKYDTIQDSGDLQRQMAASMDNVMQDVARQLVPATMAIKDGIIELVRLFVKDSAFVKEIDAKKKIEALNAAPAADKPKMAQDILDHPSDNAPSAMDAANDVLQGPVAGDMSRADARAAVLAECQRQGLSAEETQAVLNMVQHESGFNAGAVGPEMKSGAHKGDAAHGLFQYMAKSSVGWNRDDPLQNIAHGVGDFKRRRNNGYSIPDSVAAHFAGDGAIKKGGGLKYNPSDGNEKVSDYVRNITGNPYDVAAAAKDAVNSDKLPAGAVAAAGSNEMTHKVVVSGEFIERDQYGVPTGRVVKLSPTVSAAVPQGANG
jgi:hypothetical protein